MTEEPELKLCPFCGGEAEILNLDDDDNEGGSCVSCKVCLACTNVEFGRKENFVSNWNRRAEIDRLEGEVERLTHERDVAYEGQLRDARYRAVAEQQAEDAESALSAAETRAEKAEAERDAWKRQAAHRFEHMRAALDLSYHLRYPVSPDTLDSVADEIDCGGECETAWRDYSTNATGCSRQDTDGCPFDTAAELRAFAQALRVQAWTLALSPPPSAELRAQLAEGREKALVEALTSRAYLLSRPHLSGYQVILGYESLADAQAAQSVIVALPHVQSKEGLGDASVGGVQAAPDGATYEPRPAGQWQPIATAPTNRITVLLRDAEGAHYAGYFFDDYWSSVCGQPAVYPVDPTHWMPLPAPPSSDPHPSDGGRG